LQGFRRKVHHYGFAGSEGTQSRGRFAHGDASNGANDRRDAFDVLDMSVDNTSIFAARSSCTVLITLAGACFREYSFAPVRRLRPLEGGGGENGLNIHLLKNRSLYSIFFLGTGLNICEELFNAFAPVRFHDFR